MKRQRRILYLAGFVIALLVAINILSYSGPSEEMMTAPVSVEVDPQSVVNLQNLVNELKELNSVHDDQQKTIESLRDTVQRLQGELRAQSKQETSTTVVTEAEDDSQNSHETTKSSSAVDIGEILSAMDDVKYPEISISNKFVSDTPSDPNAVLIRDIHDDAVIFVNGVIHGSPLLLDRCMTSLTEHHELDVLSAIAFAHNDFVPWFWSRESIGAALQNERFDMEAETFDGSESTFVVLDNSGSVLMSQLMSDNTVQEMSPNERMQTECGWTIVQHPVRRFIAAYIRMNVQLWKDGKEPSLAEATFHKVTGDLKSRLRAFLKDLRKYHYDLISSEPAFAGMATQTGKLGVSQIDIHHVVKYEFLQQEFSDSSRDDLCMTDDVDFVLGDVDMEQWTEWTQNLGLQRGDLENDALREWIGLPTKCGDVSCTETEELVMMDILYMLDAMDYENYSGLVEFYWQDFECFDYAADYHHDVLMPLISEQEGYPGFPVRNRTKTTWDLIMEFHHASQKSKTAPNWG